MCRRWDLLYYRGCVALLAAGFSYLDLGFILVVRQFSMNDDKLIL